MKKKTVAPFSCRRALFSFLCWTSLGREIEGAAKTRSRQRAEGQNPFSCSGFDFGCRCGEKKKKGLLIMISSLRTVLSFFLRASSDCKKKVKEASVGCNLFVGTMRDTVSHKKNR